VTVFIISVMESDMLPPRFTLRELPFSARLTLALFLVSVGLGYGAAIIQIHFQHASPGEFMPSAHDVVVKYHGDPDPAKRVSALQRLIEASEEGRSFNGSGSMAPAFTTRSTGWRSALREKPEAELRRERDGERDAVLLWLKEGANQAAYDGDRLPLPVSWGNKPVTAEFKTEDGAVKIKSLLAERCARCHQKDGDDQNAANYPLDSYAAIFKYTRVEQAPGAMSVVKLAQSTHAHLLSFAMLYTLTGLLFALTNYPAWLRVTLGPLVLAAQLVDIACWWLARIDGPVGEQFALAILTTGGIVAVGLSAQIVLTLFHLFDKAGRCVLVVLFLLGGAGLGILKQHVIDPHLEAQRADRIAATPGKT